MNNIMEGLDMMTVCLAAVSVAAAVVWWWMNREMNLPPGPEGLPLIGNLIPFLKAASSNALPNYIESLHEEYGPIISFKMGILRFVFINDGMLLRKLFATEEYGDRPTDILWFAKRLGGGKFKGLGINNGPSLIEMRKLALATFRDLGVGKKSVDEVIHAETAALCQYVEEEADRNDRIVTDFKTKFQAGTANIIHHVVFGFRYEYNDKKFLQLVKWLQTFADVNFLAFLENFFPIIEKIPFASQLLSGKAVADFFQHREKLQDYTESQIESHRETYTEGETRDFIDVVVKCEQDGQEHYDRENIFNSIVDVFSAGSDTTATAILWCVSLLVQFPEIQEKLRNEVDENIGGGVFNRADRDKLPLTRAFINETLRCASIAPFIPPHTVRKPTPLNRYTLPPNCLIFGTLFALHNDKSYWKDPENFRIERWLDDKSGELLLHESHFLPFGTGRRVCIGQQIARIQILLFLVELLQNFRFESAGDTKLDFHQLSEGFMRSPADQPIKVTKRQ